VLLLGIAFDRERLAEGCADPQLAATDAAEALVAAGLPFRDAHERVAAEIRAGTFEPPAQSAGRSGPAAVLAALADAKARFGA
jgi:argininosuccinate lyase